jgi:hypothetical protein
MLKLRSIARAAARGNSPSAKVEICCGSPPSRSSKSAGLSPEITVPALSVTLAYTSTRLTPEVN